MSCGLGAFGLDKILPAVAFERHSNGPGVWPYASALDWWSLKILDLLCVVAAGARILSSLAHFHIREPPTPCNLLERDSTFVTLPFNNAMCFLKDGPHLDATRRFPLLCVYGMAHWLTLNRIRDNPAQRTLTSAGFTDSTGMTVDFCANICNGRKNIYAGVENGEDCCKLWNVLTPGATSASSGDCNSKCVGDTNEICGGTNRLNLYWSGATPQPQPTFVPNVGRWDYVGCFSDSNDARLLTVQTSVNGGQFNNSVESCINACNTAGYPLAGVEFANECWCDNGLKNGGKSREIDTKNCMLACSGSSSEICGGANSLVLYYNGADQPMTTATAGPG
ncbi:WSC domain-containing protein [Lactarius psammicola]|nr:WSC domain-containing protein [Lactarius psammicola]